LRTYSSRPRLRVFAPLVVVGTLILAAQAASGLESRPIPSIPDSAFRRVVIQPGAAATSPVVRSTAAPAATPDLRPLADPFVAEPARDRAQPSLPAAQRIAVTTLVAPSRPSTSHSISGRASWYCRAGWSPCTNTHPDGSGFDAYAAAGPALRAAIGPGWRGSIVYVDGVRVKLIDWCQCYRGEPQEKLLDLYYDVFARTGSNVTIRW
jgi:hypothetical protein